MLDRLTSMRVFVALIRLGTFAAAADALGMSRAMASKHLRALEDHLGARLVNRTTRAMRLTAAGTRYFERVHTLLDDLADIESMVSAESDHIVGRLTVAAPPAYGVIRLVPRIAEFMALHPALTVKLVSTDRLVDLVEDGVDVAITVRDLEDSSNVARHLTSVRLLVCGAPAYLAQAGIPEHPSELSAHNCLVFSPSETSHATVWQFQHGDATDDSAVSGDLTANTGDALRAAAVAGRGLARLPDYLVERDIEAGLLEPVLQGYAPPARPVHALYAARRHLPARVRHFIDFLAASFAAADAFDAAADSG